MCHAKRTFKQVAESEGLNMSSATKIKGIPKRDEMRTTCHLQADQTRLTEEL